MKSQRGRAVSSRRGRSATVRSNQARATNPSSPKTKETRAKKGQTGKTSQKRQRHNREATTPVSTSVRSHGDSGASTVNQAPPFLVAAIGASAGGLEAFS